MPISRMEQDLTPSSSPVFPIFLKLAGRKVVLVGGGTVAASKLQALRDARAQVTVVAPEISTEIEGASGMTLLRRPFQPADLDGAWLVVAAASPDVNRQVAAAAEARRVFVNAVDDPRNATAYLGGTFHRGGVLVAVSTEGQAPALAGLVREGLEAVLPDDLHAWTAEARAIRRRWIADAVPMPKRRPQLLQALNRLYDRKTSEPFVVGPTVEQERLIRRGFVSLVGAGPGDPGLLTELAVRRLKRADVVLYDALVSPEVLEIATHAQRFCVGKRAGRKAMRQETIHHLMIRAARRGKRVVRLKGGDPFVLGRGGEEALALRAAGVAFEVVPGVTTAIAALGLAGIPVTHRGLASAFLVVSGHAESAYRPVLEGLAPNSLTVIVLMGLASRAALARLLLARGWRPGTPAAIVLAASTPRGQTWVGRLDELGTAFLEASADAPGTLAIGEVVALRAVIGPRASQPEAALAAGERRRISVGQ